MIKERLRCLEILKDIEKKELKEKRRKNKNIQKLKVYFKFIFVI